MREEVKSLWKLCFNDSEEFIEMYFRLRYSNEVNMSIRIGKELVAALQLLPYPMTFCGHTIQTSYISGACTHPEFRGNGIMRELLSQSFTRMFHNGIQISTLIPAEAWLFNYYERMGYASVFQYSTKEIIVPEFIPSKNVTVEVSNKFQEDVYQYLNNKLSERSCCVQHTETDFHVILTDLPISSGFLFVARQENKINGIAIVYKRDTHLIINELFAENKDAEHGLLHNIKQHTGFNHITQLLPPDNIHPQHHLGMARIINAKEVLQLYASAFPDKKMQLELVDEQISENSGYYYLYGGRCMFSTERLSGAHIQTNISELTNKILLPLQPYMSLMLN